MQLEIKVSRIYRALATKFPICIRFSKQDLEARIPKSAREQRFAPAAPPLNQPERDRLLK